MEKKWKNFHSNFYNESQIYHLLYEDGQKATLLPGSKETFSLSLYQEELGKEFKCISFFLCSNHDYLTAADVSDDEEHSLPSKRPTVSPVTPGIDLADQIEEDKTGSQVECDEQLARMLQESYDSLHSLVEVDNVSTQSADDITVVKNLAKKVNDSGEFFIVVRRNSPVARLL